jgi:lipoyl-dependent peroxiredoxin
MAGAEVTAQVSLLPIGEGRFGLEVQLEAWLPDVDAERTRELMAEAHEVCPYSNATRGNVGVALVAAEAARLAS